MYIVSKNSAFPTENGTLGVFDRKKFAVRAIQLYIKKHYGNVDIEEVVALPGFKEYQVEVDGYTIIFIVEPCDMNYMEDVGEITEGDLETGRDAKKGLYNGEITYCPVNAYGDCPYCDQCNICHIEDPQEECDDWMMFYDCWEEWLSYDDTDPDEEEDFSEDEIKWAGDVYGYEDTMEDNEE